MPASASSLLELSLSDSNRSLNDRSHPKLCRRTNSLESFFLTRRSQFFSGVLCGPHWTRVGLASLSEDEDEQSELADELERLDAVDEVEPDRVRRAIRACQ